MISSVPTDAAPQSVIEHATTTERSRHVLPIHDRDAPLRANRVDLRALPSAIWLADFTVAEMSASFERMFIHELGYSPMLNRLVGESSCSLFHRT